MFNAEKELPVWLVLEFPPTVMRCKTTVSYIENHIEDPTQTPGPFSLESYSPRLHMDLRFKVAQVFPAALRCSWVWEFFKWLLSGLLRDADRSNQTLFY